jgi:hypothetical protein
MHRVGDGSYIEWIHQADTTELGEVAQRLSITGNDGRAVCEGLHNRKPVALTQGNAKRRC